MNDAHDSDERVNAFLVAVRKLEREHGLYLYSSEWLSVQPYLPKNEDYNGIFSAANRHEDTLKLIAMDAENQRVLEELAKR
jgi:hypothetical protein